MHINDVNKNIHIKDYLSILRRRKWIIISFFFVAVTSVTITTFMQDRIYRATATVLVDVESPNVLSSVSDVVKLGESNYFAYRDYIETQQEIIRSRRTAHHVMKNLKLSDKKEFREAKDPVEHLLKKLHVDPVRDTRILKIEVDDKNPKQASLIANEFATVYADSNVAMKMKMSDQAQSWLKKEVDEQKKKLTESELGLQAYKENSDIVSLEEQRNIINSALARLSEDYLDAQKKSIKAENTYRNLIDSGGNVTFEKLPVITGDSETLQQLKEDYLKQESLLVEYRKVYKDKHPKMVKLLENINYLELRIKSEIETEYNNAVQEQTKFKNTLDEQKRKALELERNIIQYNALKREVETNERMLQIVLNRLKETSISTQIQTNNVRVQDLAETPKRPIKPKRKLNIALSMIFGLVGGVSLALFRDYMDTSLKDPADIANLLQIQVLGSVPKIKPDGKLIKIRSDIDRIVEKDSHSMASEAYRSIRTNLLFSLNHSSSSKSVVITSSVPREGKTLTAVNLAIMIANSGERVLLVDGDMRKPRIHMIFNDKNESGLSNFLLGKTDFDDIVNGSGIDNLYFVTSGNTSPKPAELISSDNMRLFLENAASRFSKIIIDTPPVTLLTDAAILSSMCTGVILVAGSGKTTRTLLNNSKELLLKVEAKILGVIVNNISLTKDIYSYPQYYYGKYYSTV